MWTRSRRTWRASSRAPLSERRNQQTKSTKRNSPVVVRLAVHRSDGQRKTRRPHGSDSDDWTLQRAFPLHRKSSAIDSGGRNAEPQGKTTVHGLQRGKPSAWRGPSPRNMAVAAGRNFGRRTSQQELGRICSSGSTGDGFRNNPVRFGSEGNVPGMARPTDDGTLGNP